MSTLETRKILLVSQSENWRIAMSVALEGAGATVAEASAERWASRVANFTPAAFVVDVDGDGLLSVSDRVSLASQVARQARQRYPSTPVIIIISSGVPREELNRLAEAIGIARVSLPRHPGSEHQVEAIRQALDELAPDRPNALPAECATIEITIGQATLSCDIKVGDQSTCWGPADWKERSQLNILNSEFKNFESSKTEFGKLGQKNIEFTGQRLLLSLFKEPLESAYRFCQKNLSSKGLIHHRIVLDDGDLEYVPFEVVCTSNTQEYLRFVHPIARRHIPRQPWKDANRPSTASVRARRRVLFILSNASGIIRAKGLKFKTLDELTLGKLLHLDQERANIAELYAGDEFEAITLAPDADNIGAIKTALAKGSYDIVHFAGHSVRADETGQVFLALPALPARPVVAFDAEDFARLLAQEDVRLLILSSCEGTSGLALSRMASWGIPAVAGFRWPVDDRDASLFTTELHRELWRDACVPLSLAFHRALVTIKSDIKVQRLTGFSPILMIQPSTWHDFHPGVHL